MSTVEHDVRSLTLPKPDSLTRRRFRRPKRPRPRTVVAAVIAAWGFFLTVASIISRDTLDVYINGVMTAAWASIAVASYRGDQEPPWTRWVFTAAIPLLIILIATGS